MENRDRSRFASCLLAVSEVYGKSASEPVTAIWWDALATYPIGEVELAFRRHISNPDNGQYAPKPADIIRLIGGAAAIDGRPGANEAWAMIPQDEAGSVVWTDEMAAAFGIAADLLAAGQTIAARSAFIESYERLVAEARAARRPVRWTPSLGTDASRRTAALEVALQRGRISASHLVALLTSEPTREQANVALVTLVRTAPTAEDRERLRGLRLLVGSKKQ
jgi:hypothetical protein